MNSNQNAADIAAEVPSFAGLPLDSKMLEGLMRDLVAQSENTTDPLALTQAVLATLVPNRASTPDS